jgi:3-oxoacyl-[acyl-carrier protein] reductase
MAAGRLSGKVAIVTGAGRGNGRAIAQLFGAEGAQVVAVDMDAAVAAKTVDAITAAGGTASAFEADVSRQADNEAMAGAALQRYGRIDVVCANAGIYPPATLDDMREQDWDRVLGVNLKSVLFAVKAALPHLKAQRSGRIVVTSSITGPHVGIPGLTHYAASKGGINGFIRSAALELAPYNITINAVEPGTILTEGVRALMRPDEIDTLAQAIPLKKLGDPEDVAFAMLFLASDEAKYITGQTLVVDGGQILPESKLAIL